MEHSVLHSEEPAKYGKEKRNPLLGLKSFIPAF